MRKVAVLVSISVAAAVAAFAPAVAQDADSDGATLEERTTEILKTCFQCHGKGGVSTVPSRPSIAGQNANYVARQLMAFKRAATQEAGDVDNDADDGQDAQTAQAMRANPVMEHMAQNLSPGLIQSVARAVSQLPCGKGESGLRQPPAKPPITARCEICHGETGIAVRPEIPNIAGQKRAYLRRQLLLIRETAYGAEPREGERWRSHPIMEREAGRIAITDVDALARYYAAQDCKGG